MPKSKKPRKKGAHGREQAARSRLLRNQFKDPAECRRLVKIVEDARAARHKGSAQLGYLFALADQDFMVERFIEAFMALERWQTTEEMDDFSLVNSMLMIGAIAFLKVGVQESERLDEIRRAAYAATLAIDHRNMGRRIPDELIEDTREGLTTAQMIFEAATANGMNQELIEVLKENDPEHIASTPGRFREHRRLILGDYLEKVQALEAAQNPHREFTVPEIASLAHQPKARVNGILETLAGKGTELHVRTVHGLTLVSFGGRLSFAEEERNRRLERERLKAEEAKREAEEEKSMRVERIEKGRMQAEKIRIMAAPSPNWFDAIVCAGDAHA